MSQGDYASVLKKNGGHSFPGLDGVAAIDGHRERALTRGGGLDETEGVWALLCGTEYLV